ncbi:uncharacterized protein LY79DRAFT_674339 [Colletotrichum navitas]|uniref:Uncharacterized protein n=1 Tax=Colletotrichum navitas TaxID=681940 RepID=A0AAD8PLH1_9PEZI|nr:uncharacterized protein LY79DRAFT_674339 [Colletotrichum navitas]KAK1569939.1 hypothetical protein LY79DRAFT_674339 [Colletotrichum navitas]
MDDTAVEAATSQMGLVSLEPHETTPNETVPLVSLPIELFFEIVSSLVHDIRSWQHQLDYLTHDHLIALTQRVKIGHLRSLALTCRTMQRKVALFCCAQADLVVPRLDAAEQLVGLLRRLGERPKRAQSVRRLYLGLDTVRCYAERIDPHIPLLMQAACATPGVAVPEILRKRMREVQDKTAYPTACLQLWPAIPEVLAFLALLSTSRLKELQECTIATGPEVLAAMAERLPRGEPFFPKIESLTLAGVRSAYGNQSLVLKPSVVSGFLATSPQLTGLRLDRFEFRLAQPVTGVENISSIILRSVALDVPSFRLLLKGCKRLGTFMYFAQSEADCGARQGRQLPEAHDIADALGHSADTLRTLCLDLGQVSVAQSGGQRALFSVSNFKHLQRIWIDSKTVLANMHTLAQEASDIPGAGGEVAVARANKVSHFLRTLPGSLNKLHLSGPAHGLAIEMPYLAGAGGLKQLAVEPAVAKDAVTILKEAGIKVLEVADPRPVLW